jgi:hypothetical protein
VDEETRQPIDRPWLTLAMDISSRMVTGSILQWKLKDAKNRSVMPHAYKRDVVPRVPALR